MKFLQTTKISNIEIYYPRLILLVPYTFCSHKYHHVNRCLPALWWQNLRKDEYTQTYKSEPYLLMTCEVSHSKWKLAYIFQRHGIRINSKSPSKINDGQETCLLQERHFLSSLIHINLLFSFFWCFQFCQKRFRQSNCSIWEKWLTENAHTKWEICFSCLCAMHRDIISKSAIDRQKCLKPQAEFQSHTCRCLLIANITVKMTSAKNVDGKV